MNQLLGHHKLGRIFVISAPSGTGKTTLVRLLVKEFPEYVAASCSCTTREPRYNEIPGEDYHFLSREQFISNREQKLFLEEIELFGHYYGTLKETVKLLQSSGKHVLMTLDTQGLRQVQSQFPDLVSIFIRPPSQEIQLERILQRQHDDKTLEERLAYTQRELSCQSEYDYHFTNDELHRSYQILKSIIIAEEYRRNYVHERHIDQ